MATKKPTTYVPTIVLRKPEIGGGYWYVDSFYTLGKVRVHYGTKVTERTMKFTSKQHAKDFLATHSVPDMNPNEPWEVYIKYNRSPVSQARKRISKEYCQNKRQLAGIFAMLINHTAIQGMPATRKALKQTQDAALEYLTIQYKVALTEVEKGK